MVAEPGALRASAGSAAQVTGASQQAPPQRDTQNMGTDTSPGITAGRSPVTTTWRTPRHRGCATLASLKPAFVCRAVTGIQYTGLIPGGHGQYQQMVWRFPETERLRRLVRAGGLPCGHPLVASGRNRRSVKPSAQPTLVRTQHLPPPAKTARWLRKRSSAGRFLLVTACIKVCHASGRCVAVVTDI